VDDEPNPLQRLCRTPLITEIAATRRWARRITASDDLELFLNTADAKGIPEGWRLMNMPIYRSIGVPQGTALIFDRRSGQYIRNGEQLRTP
jgi:hypothetical protein